MKSTAVYSGTSLVGRKAGFRRTFQIAWVLAKSDLKQRYFGSVLGALWTLLRPLMLFGVLYVVFSHILPRVGTVIPHYALYLLMSLSMWQAFAELTSSSLGSLVARGGVLQKISIPVISIPLSVAIGACVQFGASLVVLLGFLLASGVPVQAGWLLLPVGAVLVALFAGGVGLLLAISHSRFRDVGPIWEVFSSLMFWATPIIYVSYQPPSKSVKQILGLNPLSQIFTELHHYVIDTGAPTSSQIFSTWVIVGSALIFVVTIAAGWFAFNAFKDRVIEFL